MDFRAAGNPVPFTSMTLRADDSPLTDVERSELDFLLPRAIRAAENLKIAAGKGSARRGEVATAITEATGYLNRAWSALLTVHSGTIADEDLDGQAPAETGG